MKKPVAIKSFTKLTDRAASANYELSKRAILLHERLLGMGGPYLTNKNRIIVSFESYEEPLQELASKGLIIVVGEDLINPYYFTDTETPSGDYRYKKVPQSIAARLFVSSDLIIIEKGSGGTLDDFQEKIWGEKTNRYKGESGIKTIWTSYCRELEGGYREETRLDKTRLDKTRLDKTRLEETRQENISFPSSCSSSPDDGIGIGEDEEPLEDSESKKPSGNMNPLLFQHEWKDVIVKEDTAKKSELAIAYSQYSQEEREQVKNHLTEAELDELNEMLPF